ncbi:MAG: HYR domain-containing protein [Saprospiraceae bacterium]|nr:HYR domain-containing protein [Saprospiraceae bacterium]
MMKIFTKVQNKTIASVKKYLSLPLLLFIFVFLFSTRTFAQAPLKVIVPDVTVSCNDTVSLAVTIQDFDSILTSKFILKWDSTELKFVSLSKLNTTLFLNVNSNFGPGLNAWKAGKPLIFLYTEPSLNGISLPDNDTLFVLKFIATDTIGQTTHLLKDDSGDDVIKLNGEALVQYSGGNVLLKDIIPPVINCPSNLTVSTLPGLNSIVLTGSGNPSYTDNCDPALDLSYYITGNTQATGTGNANGTTLNTGQNVIHYVVKDDDNNKDTCTLNVQVNFTPGNNPSSDTINFKIPTLTADCNGNVDFPILVENYKGIASTRLFFGIRQI